MKKEFPKRVPLSVLVVAISIAFSNCSGGNPTTNATWSLVKLVSVGEPIENSAIEVVEVKNCGEPFETTTNCTAGTSNDLNMTLTSGGAFGTGAQFIIEGNVGTNLGIGQQSGQSIKLPNPPDGYINSYTVNKSYQIKTGQLLAHSSNGDEQVANFNFYASCSIDVISFEQTICSNNNSSIKNQPVSQPTIAQIPTQAQVITLPDLYVAANAEGGVAFTAETDGNYRFTIKEGTYCWGGGQSKCRSIIHGYLNRDIAWGLWYNMLHPINQDYELGCWENETAANQNCSVGQTTIVAMKGQQNIKWVIMEQKGSFGDDTGYVRLTVEKLP